MDIFDIYQRLLRHQIPDDIILNTIFILEGIRQSYFISFKKYIRKYKNNNIFDIVDNITFICNNIRVIKLGEAAIILYHSKNVKIFDKVNLKNINNYLDHPKVYNNIQYGLKYSLQINKLKVFKTASYNLQSDFELFNEYITKLKIKMEKVISKLNLFSKLDLVVSQWYSKDYMLNILQERLNIDEQNYLIKLLNSSKFDKLSGYLSSNKELINRNNLQLSIIVSYIKSHKIINKTLEMINWENILIEMFKKVEK